MVDYIKIMKNLHCLVSGNVKKWYSILFYSLLMIYVFKVKWFFHVFLEPSLLLWCCANHLVGFSLMFFAQSFSHSVCVAPAISRGLHQPTYPVGRKFVHTQPILRIHFVGTLRSSERLAKGMFLSVLYYWSMWWKSSLIRLKLCLLKYKYMLNITCRRTLLFNMVARILEVRHQQRTYWSLQKYHFSYVSSKRVIK